MSDLENVVKDMFSRYPERQSAQNAIAELAQLRAELAKQQRHAERWRNYAERAHAELTEARAVIELAQLTDGGMPSDIDARGAAIDFLAAHPAKVGKP